MKRLYVLLTSACFVFFPGSLSAQDAPTTQAPTEEVEAARFSPATVAAAVDDERPPLRERVSSPERVQQRRQVRRVRVRRALVATAVLTGVVAAAVGVSKSLEPRTSDPERDEERLLGLLILLGL